ncbi:MAG: STAS domain-containing protein [Anaeromyxobacteraceae bacterium]
MRSEVGRKGIRAAIAASSGVQRIFVIPLSQKVLLMPLIGTIDAGRAGLIIEASLLGIARHRASHLILDITGVPEIDTLAADALVRTSRAVRIIGARAWMTGISPAIARTLAQIQADLGELSTYGTVQEAVARLLRGKSL